MSILSSPSLQSRYDTLDAERRQTWSPEAVSRNIAQRQALVRDHAQTPHVEAGDILPPHFFSDVNGAQVSLDDLTASGPAVLLFFRFADCAACNIALPYYAESLAPTLKSAGIPLVAVSAQPFPVLDHIRARHDLPFPVLNDAGLTLARILGITYIFDDISREAAIAKGERSEALNGTENWELPKPTVLVLTPGRVVSFVEISPDWMSRPETDTILKALGLSKKKSVPDAA
ncbi:peroxiredoxin-like family protein [Gluconobacter kanchanaburiensis]|nr:peroxiredoxin-like family protein [Gluconobacter kanchanaburiensis]MBF0861766.1 AhpC/TSA family protein [Gluconobacter kanchanaburiensis]